MLRTRTIVASFLSLFFGILALEPCVEGNSHAALTPEQLIILVNDRDPDSVRLGRFYARRRGIPPSHIIALDLPYRESMSRTEYEEDLVQPLRKALVKKNLSGQTRAIATIYGVPLKIQAPYSTNQEKRWAQDALEWQQATMTFVRSLRAQLTDLLEAKSHKNSSNEPQREKGGPANHSDLNQLVQSTGNALTSAQIQIANLADSPALSEKKDRLSKIGRQLLGLRANLQAQEKSSLLKTQERSRALLSREIRASNQLLTLLLQDPSDKNRNLAYQLAQRYLGLFGVLSLTIDEINRFTLKDADASVDSELSLLWYEPGEYRLSERSPNPLYAWQSAKSSENQDQVASEFPLLMISRIDAPTPQLAQQMVEQAILAEQTGITGKAYIDARGLNYDKVHGTSDFADYDESLRALARLLEKRSDYSVILDNTDRRFSLAGEASSVGLYAGWYRYRHYEDAFTFNPGAIGYHIASGEAISIHNPKEAGW
ncbi:MAG: TIGR03790 family protein, partial [Nitrospirota bacterium]|nr:TIGR03790 family protein [Nitrospirota bacterium]